jgi:hypothetical protein
MARRQQAGPAGAGARALVTPPALGGMARVRSPEVLEMNRAVVEELRQAGLPNAIAANYGSDPRERGVFITMLQSRLADRRAEFVRRERADLARYPGGGRPGRVRRAELGLTCAQLGAGARPLRSWCTWDQGDTAGVAVGYGRLDARRLASLVAAAHQAATAPPIRG